MTQTDSKLVLITLLVELGVAAAVSSSLARSKRFKDLLLMPRRTPRQTVALVAIICAPLTLGVWVRATVPNFLAADLSFETTILLGILVGPLAAMAGGGCASMASPAASSDAKASARFAYVGGYTSPERKGHAEGLSVYRIDAGSGAWTLVQVVRDLVNPSWLTLDRQRRCIYAAHGDGGEATAFQIEAGTGRLTLLNRQATNGKNGVRLGVDANNRFIVLANYSSGTVAVLPINADGSLAPLSHLATLTGKPGPHRAEQASAHPHDVVFDPRGRFIVVPDKGLDAVFVFRLDNGQLVAADPPSVASRGRGRATRTSTRASPTRT